MAEKCPKNSMANRSNVSTELGARDVYQMCAWSLRVSENRRQLVVSDVPTDIIYELYLEI